MKSTKALALHEHGLIMLPFYEGFDIHIKTLMDSWRNFCTQDLEHKETFIFTSNGGYEYKDQSKRDYKENFHISLGYSPEVFQNEIDKKLFLSARMLINESFPLIKDISEIMGEESDFDLSKLVLDAKNRWTIRLLHYPPHKNSKKELLADPHIDKGITVHLTEDREGLEVFWKGKWVVPHMMANHVLTYPGMLAQYYSSFPALCHRVRALPETLEFGRNSIVMFIDFGDVVYDKKVFGSTQEVFPEGENYKMSSQEFSKFFTKTKTRVL